MDAGRKAAKKIISAYPDYGKAPPEYVVNLAESLSYLTEDELAVVTHPVTGVISRTKFLPTFADITAVLQDHKGKQEQFKPAHTQYHRLADEPGPWDKETDFERKKRVVRELLGYNPDDVGKAAERRIFTPPTADDLATIQFKTPAAPVSDELKAMLRDEGYPYLQEREDAA